jgi:alanyl-tRNA synthetase
MKSAEIRQAFLDYFANLGHQKVSSSSLVPANDQSLLFTNAGMVQFKDVFLGSEQRSYQRAVSVQRCVRAGGKHNDLENVGFTARHHTFFEMLGNFSFGDYFKSEAIRMAWDFLTKVLQIPAEKLWVTVYEEDLESENIWLQEMGLAKDRVIRCGAKDNFWAMGDTGPCGPCTEIYYDHGAHIAGGLPGTSEMDGDRYVEIWNVVFMQFNRDPQGNMHPLPKPSVDTGMGLERIAAVMQGVNSNYDTDIFIHLRQAIEAIAPGVNHKSPSILVIADHIRSCGFLLADGVMPSNEGRGYVLRRIIRRAVRHGHQLGLPSPFMHQLLPALVEVMGDAYPELRQHAKTIQRLLKQEEEQFMRTISQGLKLLQDSFLTCKNKLLPGDVVFKLYDTYGFPVDLTADAAREKGYEIDNEGFLSLMQAQRAQSQAKMQFHSDYLALPNDLKATQFEGYAHLLGEAKVEALFADHEPVNTITSGSQGIVILAASPFYAESGGQIGDRGRLIGPHGDFMVTDTQKKGEFILHLGFVEQGEIRVDEKLKAEVNSDFRQAIRLNHSATHLLHAALRTILGNSVQQKGSLVNHEVSRFDFSFNRGLSAQECFEIEQWVNAKIRQNQTVQTEILDIETAKARGAMALFGEKYGEKVRVLTVGDFSQELCGGTHAKMTGDIGLFKIMDESSIASGVRRIEFVTGAKAIEMMQQDVSSLKQLASTLKTSPGQIQERINQLQTQIQGLEQENQSLLQVQLLAKAKAAISTHQALPQSQAFLILDCGMIDAKLLRMMSDACRDLQPKWAYVLYAIQDKQIQVIITIPKELQAKLGAAGDWVKQLCSKGGGRPDFAQGGGSKGDDFNQQLKHLEVSFAEKLA